MEKIKRSKYEHPAYSYKLLFAYFDKVDKLIEGYNNIIKRLDEHIAYHNKIDKQDNKDYSVMSKDK